MKKDKVRHLMSYWSIIGASLGLLTLLIVHSTWSIPGLVITAAFGAMFGGLLGMRELASFFACM